MKRVVVDFETYYDAEVSVTTLGLHNYVKQADAYLVSIVTADVQFCGTIEQARSLLDEILGPGWATNPDLEFWAANSNFDEAFWEKHFQKTLRNWNCILDRAAAAQLPRDLAGVVRALFGIKLDKSTRDEMKGVRWEDLSDEEQAKVQEYCLTDSVMEWKCLHALPEPSPVEVRIAEHTRMSNRRGVRVNEDMVDEDKTNLERLHHQAFKLIPWTDSGKKPLSYPAFSIWCQENGLPVPKSLDKRDTSLGEWMKQYPKGAEVVEAMRLCRGSNTKLEKLLFLKACLTEDSRLPLDLIYCGARHTRRWSSKGFNVQNLDKAAAFVEYMRLWPEYQEGGKFAGQEPRGINMRNYLVPSPGKVFGIIDFGQIEPRCLNWLVGNEPLLQKIREGFGIYEAYARSSGKWTKAEPLKKADPLLYSSVKEQVLGLGYGMGAPTYRDTVATKGLILSESQSVADVKDWRSRNPLITALWRQFDRMITSAAMDPSKQLSIELPTGDFLHHFYIRQTVKVRNGRRQTGYESYTIKGDFSQASKQDSLWGGVLTENVTQRMARDVVAESFLRLEDAGFPVIFSVHDEAIIELPKTSAQDDLHEVERLMSITPEWAPGLPIAVEGDIAECYVKL